MSSQSNPNPDFSEEGARERAASDKAFADPPTPPGVKRPRSHGRQGGISHHKGQAHEVHGGRTAARQQGLTDSSRGRGRAVNMNMAGASIWASEVVPNNYGVPGEHPDTVAARIDPRRAEPLPADHPAVLKEIKFDRISALMQPGSNDEIDQELGLDSNDDWIY